MKIVYKPLKNLFGYCFLLLLIIGGVIIGTFQAYDLIYTCHFNNELIFTLIYSSICVFLLWYLFTLLKCNHYIIELNDNRFKHKILFSKKYMYSDIEDIYIIELKTNGGVVFNILKIKMKTDIIRLRIDNLNNNDFDDLMDTMKTKTRRKFIVSKDKRNKLFPMI